MSKRTLKDWFYLEMVSHRTIGNIMQTPKKEVHFFFFSVWCIVFNCSWQLIIFDKKQQSCVKRIHLVTDDGLFERKAFYTVKVVFYSPLKGKYIDKEKDIIFSSSIFPFKGEMSWFSVSFLLPLIIWRHQNRRTCLLYLF